VIVYSARPRLVGLALWVIARGTWWSNTRIPALNKKPAAGAIYNHGAAVIDRKARYSLRIEILAYPTLAFDAPVRGVLVGILHAVWLGKTIMVSLPDGEKILKICLFVLT